MLLELSLGFAKAPSALLASAGAFGAAFVPDRAWICCSLSNHNPGVSHSEMCSFVRDGTWLFFSGSNVLSIALKMSFFSIKSFNVL